MFRTVMMSGLEKSLDTACLPQCVSWLPSVAPSFSVRGDQVNIIKKPEDFYNTLLERCRQSKKRIALASLYLGTGPLEKKLVQTIDEQLKKEEDLQVNIILDANRGTRGETNSRKMLLPLLQNYSTCQVSLFHTPMLRAPLRFLLPSRYNELVGLQHMKLYLFDDTVIISGANLSSDYFTNRQDRYIEVANCKEFADFYSGLVQRLSDVSLGLDASDKLTPRSKHPFKGPKKKYISDAKDKIWGYFQQFIGKTREVKEADTWLFPLVELPPLGVHHDSTVTCRLLQSFPAGSKFTLSTGYFNLTQQLADTITYQSLSKLQILMAHPSANGFLQAKGMAGGIPGAYTGLARNFLTQVYASGQKDRIKMVEWSRSGWTFHAKGLWFTPPGADGPELTLIGSSNFGARSVSRDLESQVAIVTKNPGLKSRLADEESSLLSESTPFTLNTIESPDRKPALWVFTMMWLFKTFF